MRRSICAASKWLRVLPAAPLVLVLVPGPVHQRVPARGFWFGHAWGSHPLRCGYRARPRAMLRAGAKRRRATAVPRRIAGLAGFLIVGLMDYTYGHSLGLILLSFATLSPLPALR